MEACFGTGEKTAERYHNEATLLFPVKRQVTLVTGQSTAFATIPDQQTSASKAGRRLDRMVSQEVVMSSAQSHWQWHPSCQSIYLSIYLTINRNTQHISQV